MSKHTEYAAGEAEPVTEGHPWPDDLFPPGHHPRVDWKPLEPAQQARIEMEELAGRDGETATMLAIWDGADRHFRQCMVLLLRRIHEGMPIPEAGDLFRLDVTDPSRPVSI